MEMKVCQHTSQPQDFRDQHNVREEEDQNTEQAAVGDASQCGDPKFIELALPDSSRTSKCDRLLPWTKHSWSHVQVMGSQMCRFFVLEHRRKRERKEEEGARREERHRRENTVGCLDKTFVCSPSRFALCTQVGLTCQTKKCDTFLFRQS